MAAGLAATSNGGVTLLAGHGADGQGQWQDSAALMAPGPDGTMVPQPKEHFGFTDGISDPVFRGQFDKPDAEALAAIGAGKIAEGRYDQKTSWSALETGEFILGQVDEGQEFPVVTEPAGFARNGTFMVWRKLRQDVPAFEAGDAAAGGPVEAASPASPTTRRPRRRSAAKMVGRWRSGIPLCAAPTWADHQRMMADWADCIDLALRKPRDDARSSSGSPTLPGCSPASVTAMIPTASKCPFGAHIRRANPRDMLDPLLSDTDGATHAHQSPPHPAARPALCRSRRREGRDHHGDLLAACSGSSNSSSSNG